MKKLFGFALAFGAVLALSGCSGEDGGSGSMDTLFLTNDVGQGIGGVGYECVNGDNGFTDVDGGFGFDSNGDNCRFTLNQDATDRPLYIKRSEYGVGVSGIPYSCTYDTGSGETPYAGTTSSSGHFSHVWGDNGELVIDYCTLTF